MRTMITVSAATAAALLVTSFTAGCKGAPPATEELARARTLIEQAERGGAQRFAANEIDQARDRLGLAEAAAKDKKNDVARNRANEAAADAEYAMARASSNEAKRAAEELQRSVETLRQEAERGIPATRPN